MDNDLRPPDRAHIPVQPAPTETKISESDQKQDSDPFKPPEEVADEHGDEVLLDPSAKPTESRDEGRWAALRQWRPTRKQRVIFAVVAVLLIGGGTALAIAHHKTPAPVATVNRPDPKPLTSPIQLVSDLTGLPVTNAAVNQRPVTGVMIENSDQARPQSGLDQAGVVFEAIAEAGITRFLALYQDTQPSYLGPVRSARPYFVQWCLAYNCALAHVGGSPDALTDITNWKVRDMNQFYNASAYERITSRAAPHNVYTSAAQLNTLEAQKGFGASSYVSLPRKTDSPSKTPNATSITINPSSSDYESQYTYNQSSDNYARSEGGAVHEETDASGKQSQITPKVVIAMVIPQSLGSRDSSGAYYTVYQAIGSGTAYVFQDGTVTQGTWNKASMTSQIQLTNASGQTIKLNAGQTWFVAVGSANDISYK